MQGLLLIAFVLAFYRWLSPLMLNPFRRFMTIPALERRHPTRAVYGAVRQFACSVLQALFLVALVCVFKPSIRFDRAIDLDPVTLFVAALLGVAEMAVATMFGFFVMQTMRLIDRIRSRRSADWTAAAKGGWIQMFFMALEVFPIPFGALSVFFYIAVEECVYRCVIIEVIGTDNPIWAIAISTGTFILYQTFHTPGWRTAIFPMLGACVIGVVHGAIYVLVPHIVPLIVAHAAYFAAAMWSITAMRNPIVLRRYRSAEDQSRFW